MTTSRRWFTGWVLVALVATQALGFMHRVAHAGQADAHTAADAQTVAAPGGWLADLFAIHNTESECRLYDAVGHDASALPQSVGVCAVPAEDIARASRSAQVALAAPVPFEARAPPRSR